MGGISDRHQEIQRRRQRKKKLAILTRKAAKASASDKLVIAAKLRKMTPGAHLIIERLGLEERK